MARVWPSWRTLRRFLIGVALAFVLLVLGIRLFAITPIAHNLVEARLEATEIRGQRIDVQGLKGDLLGRLSIDSINVSDSQGVWVTATEIDLGWRPLSYLFDHLNLTELSAQRIDIARRPILAASQASGGGVARYSLQSLVLQRLSLAESVAGPAQVYTASGALNATRTQGRLQFDLTTIGVRGDDIRADLAWGGAVPIVGTLALDAAPNGLTATFLQAPQDASVTLNLDSTPTANEWRLFANGTVAETPALALEIGISDQNYRASGDVSLDAIGLLAPLQARLGNEVSFEATVDAANTLTVMAESESVVAAASGLLRAGMDGIAIENLNLSATDIDASRLIGAADLSLPNLETEGVLSIQRNAVQFEGTIVAPQISYATYDLSDVRSAGNWSLSPASITSEMRVTAQSIRGVPGAFEDMLDGAISARFSGEYDRDAGQIRARTILLEGGSLWVLGNGSASLNGAVSLQGEARLSDVAALSSLQTSWALTGGSLNSLQLKLKGTATPSDQAEALPALIGKTARFDVLAERSADGLKLESASLISDVLQAKASGHLADGGLDIRGRLVAPEVDLAPLEADRVVTYFILSGETNAPRLLVTTRADALLVSGQNLSYPNITLDATLARDSVFRVFGDADIYQTPFKFELSGARQAQQIAIEQLEADWLDLKTNGQAQIDLATPQNSTLALRVTGATPLGGTIEADIDYAAEQLNTDVAITGLNAGPVEVDQATLQMAGAWPRFEGQLAYAGDAPILGNAQNLSGAHALAADIEARSLRIDGTASIADQAIEITSPFVISLEPSMRLTGTLSGFGGTAEIDLDNRGTAPSSLEFSGIEMSTIGPLLDRPSLRGSVAGALEVGFVDGALNGQGSAQLTGLMRDTVNAKATDLVLDVVIETDTLAANVRAEDADQDLNFRATVSAPLNHQSTLLSTRLVADAPIPVSLSGEGAIGPIWALAAPMNLRADGTLALDINNGAGRSWRFSGPMSVRDAVFEDGFTGLHLTDISATAELQPNGIDVTALNARGRKGGRVSGRGLYGFDGNGAVTLSLNELNALKRSDISASLSGTAEIERRNRRMLIRGDLELDQARVNLERLPGAGYTTLDVVFTDERGNSEGDAPVREAIELQLDVSADRRIFVAGSGVDTEWGLDARVTGPFGRPNVIGRATLIRGEADLLSRRFRFSEGAIRFVGAPIESQLSVRADRTSDDITASIILSGTLTDPEITLSSDPSLPNDEILSRVLFGRSPSELSPLEAAQLAGAAAQLAGGDALNLVGQLQEATGLDRLDIGLNEDGAATLATGKYIADDIYLEIESGGTGAPGVALEWTPLDNVAVDAEIDPELGPKVAIQWKRDFDRLPGEPD